MLLSTTRVSGGPHDAGCMETTSLIIAAFIRFASSGVNLTCPSRSLQEPRSFDCTEQGSRGERANSRSPLQPRPAVLGS